MGLKISIIILTKNNGKTIGKVLEQISAQKIDNFFEIIIVDSGSSDDTVDQIMQYDVKLYTIPPNEFGHGKTRNMATAYAIGDYLVYLSADAIPSDTNWLRNLVNKLDYTEAGATFGRQIPYSDSPIMERFFIQNNYPANSGNGQNSMKDFDVNAFFSNVNSAIKRSLWNQFKFSETLIISEDYYWAQQTSNKGYEIEYVPDAAVFHSHNYSLKQVFKRYFDSGASFSQMRLKPKFVRNGIGYFIEEMKHIWQEKRTIIPYAICYDMFKFLGFFAGIHEKWIPKSIKVHLSMHSYYWKYNNSSSMAF